VARIDSVILEEKKGKLEGMQKSKEVIRVSFSSKVRLNRASLKRRVI